jgi:hypothetical protein
VAAVDLRASTDLVLWLRGAAGATDVELRLGSAARPPGHAQNPWHRLLPVGTGGRWAPTLVGLADLPDAVRGAVTRVRLTARRGPWTLAMGPLRAVRPEVLGDVDAALRARLDGALELDGAPVPAVVAPTADPPDPPFIRIVPAEVRPAPARAREEPARTDLTDEGFVLRAPPQPLDLRYTIEAVAPERAVLAAVLEFALDALGTPPSLLAAGLPVRGEWLPPESAGAPAALHLALAAWHRAPGSRAPAVPPFNRVEVEVDHGAG